jgi:uncharacterized protein YcbX
MKIEALWSYPVKSCAGIRQEKLEITKGGPRWDRHWMIVDENGQFLTQRQLPKMALIHTSLTAHSLVMRIDNYTFEIPFEKQLSDSRSVKVWKSVVDAWIEDPLIDSQLSGFLGKKVQLVRSSKSPRQFDIHFADSRPLQLANLESLKALNEQLAEKISIERFRANIVVSGLPAFAEDRLTEFSLGGMQFEVSKPCIRCSIINVDPVTGERPHSDPLVKLKQFHAIEGQPAFGVLLVPKNPGTLALF